MKKIILFCFVILLFSCQNNQNIYENPSQNTEKISQNSDFSVSNLVDENSQNEVKKHLLDAGISPKNIENFLQNVKIFNQTVGEENLISSGFSSKIPEYNLDHIAEKWREHNADFVGNNCRITTFTLLDDVIQSDSDAKNSDIPLNLAFDMNALDNHPNLPLTDEQKNKFQNIFASIVTEKTADKNIHIEKIKNHFKNINFSLKEGFRGSMISVFFHSDIDGEELFIGHIGLLVPAGERFLFIEKLAFEDPYQAVYFSDKNAVKSYLLGKYAHFQTTETPPIIFENLEEMK